MSIGAAHAGVVTSPELDEVLESVREAIARAQAWDRRERTTASLRSRAIALLWAAHDELEAAAP